MNQPIRYGYISETLSCKLYNFSRKYEITIILLTPAVRKLYCRPPGSQNALRSWISNCPDESTVCVRKYKRYLEVEVGMLEATVLRTPRKATSFSVKNKIGIQEKKRRY